MQSYKVTTDFQAYIDLLLQTPLKILY